MLRCAIWSLKQLTGQKQFCYVSPISNSLEQMKTSGSQIPENLSLLPMISRDFICYTQMEQRPRAFSRDRYIFHMQKMIRFLKDNGSGIWKICFFRNCRIMRRVSRRNSGNIFIFFLMQLLQFLTVEIFRL